MALLVEKILGIMDSVSITSDENDHAFSPNALERMVPIDAARSSGDVVSIMTMPSIIRKKNFDASNSAFCMFFETASSVRNMNAVRIRRDGVFMRYWKKGICMINARISMNASIAASCRLLDAVDAAQKRIRHMSLTSGFSLERTLSESGTVSRGICYVDSGNYLAGVEEHHNVKAEGEGIFGDGMDGVRHLLDNHAPTSMNMWGFTPGIFRFGEELFREFLAESGSDLKKEFYIPFIVNSAIEAHLATVKVLSTPDKWFGVTYREDKALVTAKIAEMIEKGEYPANLYNV